MSRSLLNKHARHNPPKQPVCLSHQIHGGLYFKIGRNDSAPCGQNVGVQNEHITQYRPVEVEQTQKLYAKLELGVGLADKGSTMINTIS